MRYPYLKVKNTKDYKKCKVHWKDKPVEKQETQQVRTIMSQGELNSN